MQRFYFLSILLFLLFLGCVSIGLDEEGCGGYKYSAPNQICENNILKDPCGDGYYNRKEQFCYNSIIYDRCNGGYYDPSTHVCMDGSEFLRCGYNYYDYRTQFCFENAIYEKCDGMDYNPLNNGCEDGVIFNKCGDDFFDPAIEHCVNNVIVDKEKFTDNRDGKIYKYVIIGTQTWMAENMRYETSNTKCYDNNTSNCEIYGKLYNWETAKTICPEGWHLPSDAEWYKLRDFIGSYVVGTKLKANSELWISGKGTDDFGFNALPGGHQRAKFGEIREVALFWSATTGSQSGSAHVHYVKYSNATLNLAGFYIDEGLANVRCLMD
ncbi:MAG: fibrobacter succinogenes major paralogous domain-containing protein [Fibromonadales bacterium]|nr:fibrobacter succinogenes major paralogous domain-containing protein [Fibromonadales bacterium]